MPNTQSEGEVLFRDTLTKLERFIKIWDSLIIMDHIETTILEGIICTLDLLTDIDVNTSELNAIKELERLATMKQKTALKIREFHSQSDPSLESILQLEPELYDGRIFDKIIDSKIDFIKKVSLSQLVSKDRVETMAALERLNEVQQKLVSKSMNILLELKIRQVVYDSRLELFAQSSTAPTVCPAKVVAAPIYASQKQENHKRDPYSESEKSKTTAKFVSSPLSWLHHQNQGHTKGDDDSNEDGEQLTPTSTIMSGGPGY